MTTKEFLEMFEMPTTSQDIQELEVVDSAHCCDCFYKSDTYKVWVCRVEGGVSIESLVNGQWVTISGNCSEVLY